MNDRPSDVLRTAALGLAALLAICVITAWWWYVATPTTVLVVRHAEKASDEADTPLSAAGEARATALARLAGDAGVTGIYASQFRRTRQTVVPLADELGLEVIEIDARDVASLADRILAEHRGSVVVVAGHSNTVPLIVAELGAGSLCPATFPAAPNGSCVIPDGQYDNLFIVEIPRWGRRTVVHMRYGEPTP